MRLAFTTDLRYVFLTGKKCRAAVALSMSLFVLITTNALAGTYKMYSCNVPGRDIPVPSIGPWTANLDGLNTRFFDNCVAGGSFGIGLDPGRRFMRRGTSAGLALHRPPTGPKSAIGIVRYRTWLVAELAGSGAPAFISDGGAFAPPGGVTPDGAPWISPPLQHAAPDAYVQLYCSTAGSSDCQFDSFGPLQARGIEVDLYEEVPPSGEIGSGTLLQNGAKSGRHTLNFSATDQESGVARVELLLGDEVVASKELASNATLCPQTDWTACPTKYDSDFSINTSLIEPGDYIVKLRVTDAAGNRGLVRRPQEVSIGSPSPASTTSAMRLTARFARSRTTYTTNFGTSAQVRGRLTDAAGRPIASARIEITELPGTATDDGTQAYAKTGPDGRFTYVASGKRPSRAIDLRYFERVGDTTLSASRRLRLQVRAASTFSLALRGVVVRYKGKVLTRPLPRGGKKVLIQGRAVGGVWQRFAVRRTDSAGRFSGRYRLRVRRPGVKLQFRVEVPKQRDYPFAPSVGRAVTRVVR